jgi:hypothetical protein
MLLATRNSYLLVLEVDGVETDVLVEISRQNISSIDIMIDEKGRYFGRDTS